MSFKGVKKNKVGSWVGEFCENRAHVYVGSFPDEMTAAMAVDDARMLAGGDYYRLNIPERYPEPKQRKCRICGLDKDIDKFPKSILSSGKARPQKTCQECSIEESRRRIAAFTELHGVGPTVMFRRSGLRQRISYLVSHIKSRSRGCREFSITVDTILDKLEQQRHRCALTGRIINLNPTIDPVKKDNISVDRIDSSKGYTPDNIQIVTLLANRAKQDVSMKEFVEMCRDVCAIHGAN